MLTAEMCHCKYRHCYTHTSKSSIYVLYTHLLQLQLCDTLVKQVSYHDLHIWVTGARCWPLSAS